MSSYFSSFLSGNNKNCPILPTKPKSGQFQRTSDEITISKECLDNSLIKVEINETPDTNKYNYYEVIPDTTTPETYKVTYTKNVDTYKLPLALKDGDETTVYRTKKEKGFFYGGKRKSHRRNRKSRRSRKHHKKTRKHYRKK